MTVLAKELLSTSFVLRGLGLVTETIDTLQQFGVFADGVVIAKLRERGQAGGLNVFVFRLVEQHRARMFLKFIGIERMQSRSCDLPVLTHFILVAKHLLEERRRSRVGSKQTQGLLFGGGVGWVLDDATRY